MGRRICKSLFSSHLRCIGGSGWHPVSSKPIPISPNRESTGRVGRGASWHILAAMKPLKVVLYTVVLLGALAGFGWFFVSQLGGASQGRTGEPAGVLLSAPP